MTYRLITIHSYLNPHEAQFARTLLEAEGIPAFLQDKTMNYITFGAVNVRLQVPEDCIEEAHNILWGEEENEEDETTE